MPILIRTLIRGADCPVDALAASALELTAAQRRRCRQRLELPDGSELAIALPPGTELHTGDQLRGDDGERFEICAAPERVLRVASPDPLLLTRAAYHLGNRHVAVEIGEGYLAIEPDPVLREMLHLLGVSAVETEAPFEPESGAYGGGHKHGHDASFAEDYQLAQTLFAKHAHPHPHAPGEHGHAHD
jgi:urease accessory protein